MDVLNLNLSPCCHILIPYIMAYEIKKSTKEFKPHVVIIVIIIIIAKLTLCYSIMSHATLIYYDASMLTS